MVIALRRNGPQIVMIAMIFAVVVEIYYHTPEIITNLKNHKNWRTDDECQ
jgi:hypothetical protein